MAFTRFPWARELLDAWCELQELWALGEQLNVPAEFIDPRGPPLKIRKWKPARMRKDIAQSARALLVKRCELLVGCLMSGDNNGACRNADFLGSLELRAVVVAVDTWLDHHRALNSQGVEKLPCKRWRNERRRVFAQLHEWILALRPEKMEVRIGRISGHLEARRARMQIRALTQLRYFRHSYVPCGGGQHGAAAQPPCKHSTAV